MKRDEVRYKLQTSEYDFLRKSKELGDNVILLVIAGSYAYGLEDKYSDLDLRGIAIENEKILLGLDRFDVCTHQDTDTTIYSLNRFVDLALKGNVNVIELLYSNPKDILKTSGLIVPFIKNRDLFLSKKMYQPIRGVIRSYVDTVKLTNKNERLHDKAIKRIARLMAIAYDVFERQTLHTNIMQLSMYGACVSMLETIDRCSKNPAKDILKAADSFVNKYYEKSTLRETPDKKTIETILIDVHRQFLIKD